MSLVYELIGPLGKRKYTMKIAFCGASGTGKSTIMDWLKTRLPAYDVNPVGSRSVALDMGYDNPYSVDAAGKRSEFQDRLLKSKFAWEKSRASFLTDRTLVDNLAYTVMHKAESVTKEQLSIIREGMSKYDVVFYCQLGSFQNLNDDPARVSDLVYHEIYDGIIRGFLAVYPPRRLVVVSVADLEARKKQVSSAIGFSYSP